MRTAYFISLHHKPDQFEWLLNAIHREEDIFLLHLDLKSRLGIKKTRRGVSAYIRKLIAGKPNIRMMPPRYSNWGGWSLSKLTLDAIDQLLDADAGWTHFVNLSGQCYPTKPMAQIRAEIADAGERQFVQMIPFSALPPDDWHLRRALMIETPARAFALPVSRPAPRGLELDHKGAQWVILTRAFCEWRRRAQVQRRIARHLSFAHLSDELVFQALVRNGPFRDRLMPHYGRSIVWPGPKVFGADDLAWLRADPGLFARKFDAAVDAEVLLGLAESGGYRRGPLPPIQA